MNFGEKMKTTIKVIISIGLLLGFAQPAHADLSDKPKLVSFTMTPDTVDTSTTNTLVTFNLVVSNPTGIASTQTQVTLSDGSNNSIVAFLARTDSPANSSLTTVTFKGTLTIPPTLPNGAYWATAKPIASLNANGSTGYPTDILHATSTSKVVGAENALLVRNGGDLNYNYPTFTGPAYDKTLGNTFVDSKFNSVATPIWKVGESFNPTDYYELTVPTLSLKIKANTPTFCTSDGKVLQLIAVGGCSFTVYTDKTVDYQYQKSDQAVTITAARTKPTYSVGVIATQSSTALPLSIQGPFIYGPLGIVPPVSTTPTVCYPVGTYINVVSGGTCSVNYSSPASATFLASDVYTLTFQITRTAQSVSFTLPNSVALSTKSISLTASATSGAPVTFQSNSPAICTVTGSLLNLLKAGACQVTALQVGTTTISPASVVQSIAVTGAVASKRLICIKNGKSKVISGTKCPLGYKAKK